MIPLLAAALVEPVGPASEAIAGPVPPAEQRDWVETPDHAFVALHRYAHEGAEPVVLCHGLSSNHRFWDLEPEQSLAVALWRAGFDVWNLDLRGHGDAVRDPEGRRQSPGWTIDDYGQLDLPAALEHVRRVTGRAEPLFVGHSMGGMALAIYLATHADPGLAGAVVVGSPLDFGDPDSVMRAMFAVGAALPGFTVPTPLGAALLGSPLGRSLPLKAEEILYNPSSFDRATERLMLGAVVSPVTAGEVRQFTALALDGSFRSIDRATDYVAALAEVRLPMLFVAGRADHVVNPDRVWAYREAVGSPDETWLLVSRANGFATDYGHLDFGCANRAPIELFPRIAQWLASHAPADGTAPIAASGSR